MYCAVALCVPSVCHQLDFNFITVLAHVLLIRIVDVVRFKITLSFVFIHFAVMYFFTIFNF